MCTQCSYATMIDHHIAAIRCDYKSTLSVCALSVLVDRHPSFLNKTFIVKHLWECVVEKSLTCKVPMHIYKVATAIVSQVIQGQNLILFSY